jgi:Ca-activated chloride channel homolog
MQVIFSAPHWLWALIPLLGALIYSFRHLHGMMKGRKILAVVIRGVLVACLVIALAGPEARMKNVGVATFFLLDRSDSISDEDKVRQINFVNESLKSLGGPDEAGVLVFGKDAQMEYAPGKIQRVDRVLSDIDRQSTDLAGAIRLANASFPDGKAKRIVILSDGNETSGDAQEAAEAAALDDVGIDHIVLGGQPRTGEVIVHDLQTPGDARIGEPIAIRVGVDATEAGTGVIQLDRNGVAVKSLEVRLTPGRNTFVLSDVLDRPGFHRYRAQLKTNSDRDERNNIGVGFVSVRGKPRILVLQGDSRNELTTALQKQGLDVDTRNAAAAPITPEEVQRYDTVVLNDANATLMSPSQMKLLQVACRDSGVGLAMIGGENSFLPGGWYGTPVAEALPVDLNIRQRKTFPSTTILIISDTSGSMGMIEDGQPKVRLAAKAAEETVRLLSANDRVGVVASTDGIEYVAPIQPLTNKDDTISQIRKLGVGGGGIYVRESMDFAERALMKENTKVRHLILLADGNDCDTQEGAVQIAAAMRANRITTTVVSIGDGKDVPFLRVLAAAGGGNFYLAKKANQLPAIFTQDAAIMSRAAIEEGQFSPKIAAGEEILKGLSGVPPLNAYCLVETRPLSRVGMRTHKDDVLLASWQYGLGSSLAFTSDAKARWAAAWVPWDGFGQFWAQGMRSIMRRGTTTRYQVSVNPEGGQGKIRIVGKDADGNPVNQLPKEVRLATPEGDSKPLVVNQTGPGTFEGRFDARDLGSYIVTVAEEQNGQTLASSSGFSIPYPLEYRSFRANRPLLAALSQTTGGRELKTPAEAVRAADRPGLSIQELWFWFVLAAMVLLPIDVAVRRLALPIGELLAKLVRRGRTEEEEAPAESLARARASSAASSDASVTTVEEQKPKPVSKPSQASSSAGSKLLERKRQKKDDN